MLKASLTEAWEEVSCIVCGPGSKTEIFCGMKQMGTFCAVANVDFVQWVSSISCQIYPHSISMRPKAKEKIHDMYLDG